MTVTNGPKSPPLPLSTTNSTSTTTTASNSTTKAPIVLTTQFPFHNSSEKKPTSIQSVASSLPVEQDDYPVRIASNISINRLEMEDLAEQKLNQLCESYYDELLEEVIQSDFEKPSIPEVILSVITDLTADDEIDQEEEDEDNLSIDHQLYDDEDVGPEFENENNNNSIYFFKHDQAAVAPPSVINTNGNIDYYYNSVRQAVTNGNSPDSNFILIPTVNEEANSLQVNILFIKSQTDCF